MADAFTVAELSRCLSDRSYLADRGLATVLTVALNLRKPLLLEGEPGVGKTEVAKAVAEVLGARLLRLQCYEGIDVSHALYDWNYARQMLYIRTLEAGHAASRDSFDELFSRDFLLRRPLLEAIEHDDAVPPVLLIDEIDRADDEFEAFLLELLADFQVTIPEIGTVRARRRPVVILTSNRTRELHDALKRRCLYHWISHPTPERELEILRVRVPGVAEDLAAQVVRFIAHVRELELVKTPGVAETIDWVQALTSMGVDVLDDDVVEGTLGAIIKYREDLELLRARGVGNVVQDADRPAGAAA